MILPPPRIIFECHDDGQLYVIRQGCLMDEPTFRRLWYPIGVSREQGLSAFGKDLPSLFGVALIPWKPLMEDGVFKDASMRSYRLVHGNRTEPRYDERFPLEPPVPQAQWRAGRWVVYTKRPAV